MTSFRSLWSSALCTLALAVVTSTVPAADDGDRPQDVGVVHASGDEAWIDVPASLGDTWKATLAELKERGHLTDADRSYLETNGQIALDTLWIAVLPGASLGAPISRVRIVVLVGADDHEARTAALVGAGAILGAIAERLPSQPTGPSPFPATEAAPAEAEVVPEAAVEGEYATYNTYNTYNTYTSYDGTPYPYYDTYYYPSVVYVWKPWWWSLGWCHNGWWLGWSSSCWNFGFGWGWGWGGCNWGGWGWNGFCNPWWANSFCGSSWNCDPWWWDCDDDWDDWDNWDNGPKPFKNPTLARQRLASAQTPSLSFERRGSAAGSPDSTGARSPEGTIPTRTPSSDRGGDRGKPSVASFQDRTTTVLRGGESVSPQSTVRWRPARSQSSGGLSSVDAFPPRATPAGDRGSSSSASRSSSQAGRSIVVSTRSSSSGTRAKPGSVTKLKGLSLSTGLGAIHDANSVGRSSGASTRSSSSSSSSFGKPSSPFTIGANSGGRSSPATTITSAPSSAPSPSVGSSHSSQTITSGPSHLSRPSSSSSSRSSAPAPSSSGSSLGSSRSSSGASPSIGGGGRSSGGSSGGSSMGSSRSSGGSSAGSSMGGGRSGGSSGGSSGGGRGPR